MLATQWLSQLNRNFFPTNMSLENLQVGPQLCVHVNSTDSMSAGALDCDMEEVSIYPDTDSPVWLLGHQLSAKYDLAELRELVLTRPWMTYRRDFPPIGESGLTSDQVSGAVIGQDV